MSDTQQSGLSGNEIAIVGLAGRFPQAPDVLGLWRNIMAGVESVREFSEAELRERGVPNELLTHPRLVRSASLLEDIDKFDAKYFGYSAREAALLDPQQRVFLEVASAALENAGIDAEQFEGAISVFACQSFNRYVLDLYSGRESPVDLYQIFTSNDKDFLATRVSFKLGLTGASMTVQTACSSSLVAVHLACENLLSFQADVALAGGVCINARQLPAYIHQEGLIHSPDGHCRPFDHRAAGTVVGNGSAVVVLRRLEDALNDGDHVWAVIRGSAVNNDGSAKSSYTAPSAEMQARAIREAHSVAGVSGRDVTYVEAHGTATTLGDPIEIAGLTDAFGVRAEGAGSCALGSIKANIGHLDVAAGIAGLVKAALALKHRTLPPQINFERPNPRIGFESGPFYVNTQAQPWEAPQRIAGVSSFGIGGTNAHVVLGEAPHRPRDEESPRARVFMLSAKTPVALEQRAADLAKTLVADSERLEDVAFTLRKGRRRLEQRRAIVATSSDELLRALTLRQGIIGSGTAARRRIVFMCPGQGSQHPAMFKTLFESDEGFRADVTLAADAASETLGISLLPLMRDPRTDLTGTDLAQTSVFAVSWALARWWMARGVKPEAIIGHSLGEYVAATLAGVMPVEQAARLVGLRGKLMAAMQPGAMLAVQATPAEVESLVHGDIELACINGPRQVVLAGPKQSITGLHEVVSRRGLQSSVLVTSHAFHTASMEPAMEALIHAASQMKFQSPRIPYASNLTGGWATSADVSSPMYWARHMRGTVRFGANLETAVQPGTLLLETGPGRALATLARLSDQLGASDVVVASCPRFDTNDLQLLHTAMAEVWASGVDLEWRDLIGPGRRRPLPTYPFARESHWTDPVRKDGPMTARRKPIPEQSTQSSSQVSTPDDQVRGTLSQVLGVPAEAMHADQLITRELGLTSLLTIELRNRLQEQIGVEVPPTFVLDNPTVGALVDYVRKIGNAPTPQPGGATRVVIPVAAESVVRDDAVAIIGASCRLPGIADVESFWSALRDGRSLVSDPPETRWRVPNQGKAVPRRGAYLQDYEAFDAGFFDLTPAEAKTLDPQQRLLLELAWEAIEHAGIAPTKLAGSDTGVFLGLFTNEYQLLNARYGAPPVDSPKTYWLGFNVAAGLVSNILDLRGPSENVNTASSSALVAVHRACRALLIGDCDTALAGGASAVFDPAAAETLFRMERLDPAGVTRCFDVGARGYNRAEAGGVVLLKRFADAQRDGDLVLAVIRGSAEANNGRAAGFGTPSSLSQRRLLLQTIATSDNRPEEVQFIEAHASGTVLGDSVELAQLAAVYGRGAKRPAIGAAHTNLGHADAAAGIVGLLKAALTVERREVAPNLHLRETHPWLNLNGAGVMMPTERRPLRQTGSRLAAVSSFGASGSIVHAIVQGVPATPVSRQPRSAELFVCSARSDAALRALLDRYLRALRARPSLELDTVCHTAALGRSHFNHRFAVRVSTRDELLAALHAKPSAAFGHARRRESFMVRLDMRSDAPQVVADLARNCELFQGSVDPLEAISNGLMNLGFGLAHDDDPGTLLRIGEGDIVDWATLLDELARTYRAGVSIEWSALERGRRLRARLPTYAFQRTPYWFDVKAEVNSGDSHV